MTKDLLHSSDSTRSARPLQYVQSWTIDQAVSLELGSKLAEVNVAYETYGQLNDAKDNAVLICHALSGDSHVAMHDANDDPGWWDIVVGPGKAIDTDQYFVICPNVLGGCRGTTGPESIDPATNKPYGRDFPTITVGDMVDIQARLVTHLGIDKLHAVVGGSLGGHQALSWAARHTERVNGVAIVASSTRLNSQALAFDVVARNAILRDPDFHDGQYHDYDQGPAVGLAIARMLGHITYLSREAMTAKFDFNRHSPVDVQTDFEKRFSVGSYLAYQGEKFVSRFDANSYLTLSLAMDLFNLGEDVDHLVKTFENNRNNWLVISFSSDWLFPTEQSRQLTDALIKVERPVSFCNVTSSCGHDAFLLEDDHDKYGELIRAFLDNLIPSQQNTNGKGDAANGTHRPTSIFHSQRLDYDLISSLIPNQSRVLDLGCGNGGLLSELKARKHDRIVGVELDENAIVECVQRGLEVIHGDINQGLSIFTEKQFDYVVLSQTLQAITDVAGVLDEMLRVGEHGVVSFPNFAYRKLREDLCKRGRSPETAGLLHYKWYDTPNRRFFSIKDFEEFCAERNIKIHHRICLDTEEDKQIDADNDPNLNADLAIFVISK